MERLFQPRVRRILVVCWALAWCGVAVLLLAPPPMTGPAYSDLVAHFGLFAGLAFGAVGFSHRAGRLAGLALLTIFGGTALEFAQLTVSYRTFDLTDAAANALGATAGYAAALIVLYFCIRPADPALRASRPVRI